MEWIGSGCFQFGQRSGVIPKARTGLALYHSHTLGSLFRELDAFVIP